MSALETGESFHAPKSRRRFLRVAVRAAAAGGLVSASLRPFNSLAQKADSEPATPAAAFDRAMQGYMDERKIPGGALAVLRQGQLVYARGYGWADRDAQTPATERSLFRIASLSKPLTAVGILKLAEDGRVDLEARPFELLDLAAKMPPQGTLDPRWRDITIRQLLHHTAGWDRDASFDPMFRSRRICDYLKQQEPAEAGDIIRYMLDQPLDFDPGTRYAYSNFGYCLLGRVIEAATGERYENWMRHALLAPAGATGMRLGASLAENRKEGEVRYYTTDDRTARSVFPAVGERVPWPYGGFHLEAMDAHGAWIASAVDLARVTLSLFHGRPARILSEEMRRAMIDPPAPPVARNEKGRVQNPYYACGWQVRTVSRPKGVNCWHNGSLPGTTSLLVHRADGVGYAALFNQRSNGNLASDMAIDGILYRAADSVTDWPADAVDH